MEMAVLPKCSVYVFNLICNDTGSIEVLTGYFERFPSRMNVTIDASTVFVAVHAMNNDGTFSSRSAYPTGSKPQSVAVGDFNNDGRLDLVVANYKSRSVRVLLEFGNGTFVSQIAFPAVFNPIFVTVAIPSAKP